VLDAARDAANRWIFPELLDDGLDPWAGTTDVYLMGAERPEHGVDVTDDLPAGVASLRAHRAYLDGLGRDFDPDDSCAVSPPTPATHSASRTPSRWDASASRACDHTGIRTTKQGDHHDRDDHRGGA
jgi:hypothetical protein